MKTIIVYGSKHGTTEKCSKILKCKLNGEIIIVNVKKDNIPDLAQFDNVIIGGSIYMGQIQKEIKHFCLNNINQLKSKNIALFICGLNDKDIDVQLNNSFPKDLIESAIGIEYFGGEIIFKKMNFFEKLIIKMVTKTGIDTSKLLEENINKLAELIK